MKIDQTTLDDHQVRLKVEIEDAAYEGARHKAARKIAKRVKIPGFRPGKAPFNVIEKQVGAETIHEEALDIILDDVYPKLLEESGIQPYGPGTLEKVDEEKKHRVFEFRVPLKPEVTLGDYAKIRIPFKEKKVTKKDIDGVINNLRDQQAVLQPVKRAAEEGDMVYVMMSVEKQSEEKDTDKILLQERRYPLVIEKSDVKTENEWPFPGFSRKLIGLEPDAELDLKHTFAKDSEFEELQGEKAIFKIKVEEIKDRVLPELDDVFAKSLGEYEDLKALTEEVKSSLTQNFEQQQRDEHDNAVVEKIIEISELKYPPQMLDHEIEHYIEDLGPQLAQQGLTMENYLTSRQMDMEALREEVKPNVEQRLSKSLVLMEVSRQEKIEVSEDEIQELVQERVSRLRELMSESDARNALSGDNLQGLVSSTMTEEIINRTLDRLHAIAKGEAEKPVGKKESKTAKPKASTKKETGAKTKKDEGAK